MPSCRVGILSRKQRGAIANSEAGHGIIGFAIKWSVEGGLEGEPNPRRGEHLETSTGTQGRGSGLEELSGRRLPS